MSDQLALIDIGALVVEGPESARRDVAEQIDEACRHHGFFRITGHGVSDELRTRLDRAAREFFALPESEKAAIAMTRGGAAWRGWFEVGGELTSGRPDHKEGLYFGTELSPDDPAVRSRPALHGPNLFPDRPPELREAVLDWMAAMSVLGGRLLEGVALGLGLDERWFVENVTAEPTTLFRIFHYPPLSAPDEDSQSLFPPYTGENSTGNPQTYGVQEHTDYGLLTILAQDGTPGLEVHAPSGWIDVPADPDVFVVNLGDMLERMTAGRYRSTPHRVRNRGADGRLSFPFFVDPSWDATCPVMPLGDSPPADATEHRRWDGASVHAWEGTYGDYLTAKVAKVFPHLFASISGD